MTLLEPDVAITDYMLALECAVLAWLVYRRREPDSQPGLWFVVLFAALGMAALLGGTAHGFVADKDSIVHAVIWSATLIAIGVAALASWSVGARLLFSARVVKWIGRAACVAFAFYVGVLLIGYRGFIVAIAHYLPATFFLCAVLLIAWRRSSDVALLAGVVGLLLTFVAAGVQQAEFGLEYFNHNALYHLIQAIALLLIFVAARRLSQPRSATRGQGRADQT